MGIVGLAISAVLFLLLPEDGLDPQRDDWLKRAGRALGLVFRNPQSILCGMIAGLLFIPTTIFDMIWGVRYLQEARGLDYASAVMRSATVPLGWIIGCPLLGCVSDRLGRRKPVIIGRRRRPAGVPRVDSVRRRGRVPALRRRPRRRHWRRRGDAAVHGDQGSQSARGERDGHRRRQLPELHVQRAARPGVRLDPADASAAERHG